MICSLVSNDTYLFNLFKRDISNSGLLGIRTKKYIVILVKLFNLKINYSHRSLSKDIQDIQRQSKILLLDICYLSIHHCLFFSDRTDEWTQGDSKNGPSEVEQTSYDGPPGMEPDGLIESNWEEVRNNFFFIKFFKGSKNVINIGIFFLLLLDRGELR